MKLLLSVTLGDLSAVDSETVGQRVVLLLSGHFTLFDAFMFIEP